MAEPAPRIPVTVIGGYLGAGKTTLVNHILRASPERIAVIVNDFGEISIDEDLIAAAEGDKLTLANGCICCSLADGFAAALATVRSAQVPPQRLLIEASGVADPAQIAAYGHTPGLSLDAVVVLADGEQVRRQANDRWVADTIRMQLRAADLAVVNKTDLAEDVAEVEELCDWLCELVPPDAAVVRATRSAVPLEVLFGTAPRPDDGPVAGAHSHAGADVDDIFESQTVRLEQPVAMATLEALVGGLPSGVVRLKGVVGVEPPPDSQGSDSAEGEPASVKGDPISETAEYVVQAVGTRASIEPRDTSSALRPATGGSRGWAVSVIARKGTLSSDWLANKLANKLGRQVAE